MPISFIASQIEFESILIPILRPSIMFLPTSDRSISFSFEISSLIFFIVFLTASTLAIDLLNLENAFAAPVTYGTSTLNTFVKSKALSSHLLNLYIASPTEAVRSKALILNAFSKEVNNFSPIFNGPASNVDTIFKREKTPLNVL